MYSCVSGSLVGKGTQGGCTCSRWCVCLSRYMLCVFSVSAANIFC